MLIYSINSSANLFTKTWRNEVNAAAVRNFWESKQYCLNTWHLIWQVEQTSMRGWPGNPCLSCHQRICNRAISTIVSANKEQPCVFETKIFTVLFLLQENITIKFGSSNLSEDVIAVGLICDKSLELANSILLRYQRCSRTILICPTGQVLLLDILRRRA